MKRGIHWRAFKTADQMEEKISELKDRNIEMTQEEEERD